MSAARVLAHQAFGDPSNPTLVLLHGFLGSADDWQPLLPFLVPHFYCVCLELPGHGQSQEIELQLDANKSGFQDCCQLVLDTLQTLAVEQGSLLGYSLGGRIALHVAQRLQQLHRQQPEQAPTFRLEALFLEASHPGLIMADERQARLNNDQQWANKLLSVSIGNFLKQWYQQPVFADLSPKEVQALVTLRQENDPQTLFRCYLATSLARQNNLRQLADQFRTTVLVGSHDQKFLDLAQSWQHQNPIQLHIIDDSGHNIHRRQPAAMAEIIIKQSLHQQ